MEITEFSVYGVNGEGNFCERLSTSRRVERDNAAAIFSEVQYGSGALNCEVLPSRVIRVCYVCMCLIFIAALARGHRVARSCGRKSNPREKRKNIEPEESEAGRFNRVAIKMRLTTFAGGRVNGER